MKGLFDWFIKRHIEKLEKQLGPLDLVWSFDLNNTMPLIYFSNDTKKIFFAADWPLTLDALKAAEGASLLVSVAQEILDQYPNTSNTQKLLIDHGVADCFIEEGKRPFVKTDEIIRIGLSGNFLRPDIDRLVLLKIITTHADLLFECFGAYELNNSNLGGCGDSETISFIESLKQAPNVILHGMVSPEVLAKELRRMDAFLICYDVAKDQSKGTNYHKVAEYMAFQRPIISNYFSHKNALLIFALKEKNNNILLDKMKKIKDDFLNLSIEYPELKSYSEINNSILNNLV